MDSNIVPMKDIQANSQNNSGLISPEEFLDNPQPTSKYDAERGVFATLDKEQADREAQALKDGNYIYKLTSDYDKIKADLNKDGKISKDEYEKFVVDQRESTLLYPQNMHENHNYIHFDYSIILSIGIVCLTIIIVSLIKRKRG